MNGKLKLTLAGAFVAGAVAAAVVATQGGASRDAARLSNRGGPTIAIRNLRMKLAPIKTGHVLALRNGRALYHLDLENGGTCFGAGPANDIGNPGSAVCPHAGFPRAGDPVLDFSVYEGTNHDLRDFSLFRVEGFAADGVAAVEFFRPNGDVALRVPVSGNVYSAASVPPGAIAGMAALDKNGNRIWHRP